MLEHVSQRYELSEQMTAAASVFMEALPPSGWRTHWDALLEGLTVTIIVSTATFLGMFLDDCRLAFLPSDNDVACEVLSFGVLVRLAPQPAGRQSSAVEAAFACQAR